MPAPRQASAMARHLHVTLAGPPDTQFQFHCLFLAP